MSTLDNLITRAHFTPSGTDPALIAAVEARWGKLTIDLAATAEDTKAPLWIGPEEDSLSVSWATRRGTHGLAWLNPVVGDIEPWAAKCATAAKDDCRILLLSQLALDADWYWDFVHPYASVHVLSPRMTYEGSVMPLMIASYNIGPAGVIARWKWKEWTVGRLLAPDAQTFEFDGIGARLINEE